jgi:hypothetical protein
VGVLGTVTAQRHFSPNEFVRSSGQVFFNLRGCGCEFESASINSFSWSVILVRYLLARDMEEWVKSVEEARRTIKAIITTVTIYWEVTPWNLIDSYQNVGGTCCPHLQVYPKGSCSWLLWKFDSFIRLHYIISQKAIYNRTQIIRIS